MIEINELKVKYRNNTIIQESSLKINQAGIIGLIGPNGSGKTSFKKAIMGLIHKEGYIQVDGVTYNSRQNYLKKIFFIENNDSLYSDLNSKDHLKYIKDIYSSSININQLISDFNMQDYSKLPVKKMSLGMKQKLLISMSIVSDAPYLLLDEPFNGLDLINSKLVADYLIKVKNSKTLIVSSHDIVHMKDICNQFIFIKDKQLVSIDNTADINLENLYYKYYS